MVLSSGWRHGACSCYVRDCEVVIDRVANWRRDHTSVLWELPIGAMGGGGFRSGQPVVPVAFGCQDAWRLGAFVTSFVDKLRGDMFNDDVRHRASVHAA